MPKHSFVCIISFSCIFIMVYAPSIHKNMRKISNQVINMLYWKMLIKNQILYVQTDAEINSTSKKMIYVHFVLWNFRKTPNKNIAKKILNVSVSINDLSKNFCKDIQRWLSTFATNEKNILYYKLKTQMYAIHF